MGKSTSMGIVDGDSFDICNSGGVGVSLTAEIQYVFPYTATMAMEEHSCRDGTGYISTDEV